MPSSTVGAIIYPDQDHRDKILLTKRNIEPFKGKWCLPGGHIDQYEQVKDAVVREVQEKTGLNFSPNFFGYFDESIPEMNIHHVVLMFNGIGKGEPVRQASEVEALEWFRLDEALTLPLAFFHNDILKKYQAYIA